MLLFSGHRSPIRQLVFSPDGARLASTAGNGYAVSLWDAMRGKRECHLSDPGERPVGCFTITPDGRHLYSVGRWGSMHRWDLESQVEQEFLSYALWGQDPVGLTVLPGEQRFAFILGNWYGGGDLLQIRIEDGQMIRHDQVSEHEVQDMVVSPCGKNALLIRGEETLRLVPLVHKEDPVAAERAMFAGADSLVVPFEAESDRPEPHAQAAIFSADGARLYLAYGRVIECWILKTWKREWALFGHEDTVTHMALSPDGRHLLSGSYDETVRIWDLQGQCESHSYNWEIGKVTRVTFAPDGMRAAAGGQGKIMVWDLED